MILDTQTGQPEGILTEAGIARAVADGNDVNDLRIRELMTVRPSSTRRPASVTPPGS